MDHTYKTLHDITAFNIIHAPSYTFLLITKKTVQIILHLIIFRNTFCLIEEQMITLRELLIFL